jgi:cytochrome c biogenesis protein CcdA
MQKEELNEVFQMLLELMVAAIIGISFGNAWVCILMSFGTRSEERSVGLWFIAGRFLGLLILGSVISLLRFAAQDVMPLVLLIFGISTILFGILILLRHYIENRFTHLEKDLSNRFVFSLLSLFMVLPGSQKCKANPVKNKDRKNCHDLHKGQRHKKHKSASKRFGFSLGLIRGATPCAKVIVLTPLLVAFGFPQSLPLILVYASTSTVYPVIGYLSADVLTNFEAHRFKLKMLGAFILIVMGLYYIIKVYTWEAGHIGI